MWQLMMFDSVGVDGDADGFGKLDAWPAIDSASLGPTWSFMGTYNPDYKCSRLEVQF